MSIVFNQTLIQFHCKNVSLRTANENLMMNVLWQDKLIYVVM
jgi:hypothetical protein